MARPGLKNHPKFRRLVFVLKEPIPHVLGYLECLWMVAYECGDPLIGDQTDVELAAEWPGERGKLCKALSECRFLDESDGEAAEPLAMFCKEDCARNTFILTVTKRSSGQWFFFMSRASR
jgi:hypothetical protein